MNQLAPAIPFELEALAMAHRYQAWLGDTVRPYMGQRVLEVGAGLGNMSGQLPIRERLIVTEADSKILPLLQEKVKAWGYPPEKVSVERFDPSADMADHFLAEDLDTIISFNVLEHVENDREALRRLSDLLRGSRAKGPKRLVTFVPAHGWAFGSMDREYGHFRRYTLRGFKKLAREVAPEAKFQGRYFNAFGLAGWVLTGRVLRKREIGLGSIRAFEALCPVLRPLDTLFQSLSPVPLVGQSLLTVLEF